jgi:hypothetical protein
MFAGPEWWADRNGQPTHDPNTEALTRVGLVVALALFIASLYPPAAIPAVVASIFGISAFAAVTLAILRQQDPLAPVLTRSGMRRPCWRYWRFSRRWLPARRFARRWPSDDTGGVMKTTGDAS